MRAIRLRTEYLVDPLGIDLQQPRLMWNCGAERSGTGPARGEGGARQTAYQIVTANWDSGKVASSSMTHIPYEGWDLHSRDIVNWSVQLWDENGEAGEWSETEGAVVTRSRSYSLSSLSSMTSRWRSPRNPHLKPKPRAWDVSGSN